MLLAKLLGSIKPAHPKGHQGSSNVQTIHVLQGNSQLAGSCVQIGNDLQGPGLPTKIGFLSAQANEQAWVNMIESVAFRPVVWRVFVKPPHATQRRT